MNRDLPVISQSAVHVDARVVVHGVVVHGGKGTVTTVRHLVGTRGMGPGSSSDESQTTNLGN